MTDPTRASVADESLELVCPGCGYDLRSIASDRCPECGLAIDRGAMSVSRIPWSHRRSIGRFIAYWRTNLLVVYRPKRLADEIARPVSFADAQRFRQVTVLLAWLPMAAWAVGLVVANWEGATAGYRSTGSRLGWWMEAAVFLSLLPALWLALLMMSGVASYFFHPRSMPIAHQDRAVALSYYASAPLAWLCLPGALSGILAGMSYQDWSQHGFGNTLSLILACAAFGITAVILVTCWLRIATLMQKVTHCGRARRIAITLYLPVAWGICGAVALLIPVSLLYVSLVILSFR